ncbi:MAG: hypothetical protein PHY23_05475 [Oscillospiraceae bacterium]|jgi:hypothetical protein|nr:hypothetical protein [Oscillospiraceae bacterium]
MTQNGRIWMAASACGLAVALLFVAGFVKTQTNQPAMAALPLAAESAAPAAAEERRLVKAYDGQVCIFVEGEALPRRNTGIYTATLPNEDQTMLEEGIWVSSQAELSSILEDYGY